ncbi:nucleotidyltransferase [Flavipsychrobacter stenotrophus]|uniref:Nucleotidyltransferase n=1 Tax=Flavipsychrobacter stenotrophus TaxID=2077091 RepID=A0A2S7SR65_9BACT|nr:DNA polymerase Y family protein [Flavipsychrobacter stenotrophus]PQJ09389.1 nucleotidyltransferase [Flavipsychrobacter stenotrophus]
MGKRFVALWFRHLTTDWMIRRRPELSDRPFVFASPERGRMVVSAANIAAEAKGIMAKMVVADCRAILPSLEVLDEIPGQATKLLRAIAEWCIRFTPVAAVDEPDGIMLDVSGCPHLWGGERPYLIDLLQKLRGFGYDVRAAIADTAGAAWAVCHFGKVKPIIEPCCQLEALLPLPPASLRLEVETLQKLEKLGLHQVSSFINMPRRALRRRFGDTLLLRLDQALGQEPEIIHPIQPIEPYHERLPCMEPIRTGTGIEIALQQLLETMCQRLVDEGKGLRKSIFKGFRIDGNIQQIVIGTVRPSRNVAHLFKLFENKIPGITPALGFELFILEAPVVEDIAIAQETLWHTSEHDDVAISELLDRIGGKVGMHTIHRYLPDEHYWPERSYKVTTALQEKPATDWRTDLPRPLYILPQPEIIEVTVPIPDYPPMLFIYKGALHTIIKADGPERIEQEWWITGGLQRDYYCVEDEKGGRYWLFRSGHYSSGEPEWYIHGFFA